MVLARDVVKGTRYGLWINSCATEEQILRIEQEDELPLSIPKRWIPYHRRVSYKKSSVATAGSDR